MTWKKNNRIKLVQIGITTLLLAACGIDEKEDGYPIQATSEESISEAMFKELKDVSILNVQKDQMVQYELNVRPEVNNVIRVSDTFRKVIFKEVNDLEAKVILREDFYRYDQSGTKVEEEKHSDIDWTESMEGLSANLSPLSLVPKATEIIFEYYNLEYQDGSFPLPDSIAKQTDCAGFVDCKVSGRYISYLRYTREDGKITNREHIRMTLSKEIPPLLFDDSFGLPPVLDYCVRDTIEGILRNMCLVLRDVKK